MYASSGTVYNPIDGTTIGTFTGPTSYSSMMPDTPANRVFFLNEKSGHSSVRTLAAFDASTFVPVWSGDIALGAPASSGTVRSFLRWGATGAAFLTADAVVLVDYGAMTNVRTLTLSKWGLGSGMVAAPGVECGLGCTTAFGQYPIGARVSLSATPDAGSAFIGWMGDKDCNDTIVTITATSGVTCTAKFAPFDTFLKLSPADSTVIVARDVALTWTTPTGALSYAVCVDSTDNNACDATWQPTGTGLTLHNLSAGTYYWQVRAILAGGTAEAVGAWWSFTIRPAQRVPGDFDGDGAADLVVFRPSTGEWFVRGLAGSPPVLGVATDIPIVGDFNGDGVADIAVFRPSTGEWLIKGQPTVTWGTNGDVPVPADYNGDGTTEMAFYRPSTGVWRVHGWEAFKPWIAVLPDDVPVPADYNGDGAADPAFYRPSTGEWFIRSEPRPVVWGAPGDVAVPADYNGDGKSEIAVYRPTTGESIIEGMGTFAWGEPGDIPVPLDVNGDGIAEMMTFRPATATWYVKYSATTEAVQWVGAGDVPVKR